MHLLTQLILLVLALFAVLFGWHWGFRRGSFAYLATIFLISLLAFTSSALWLILVAGVLPFALLAGGLGVASGTKLRQGKKALAIGLISPLAVYWFGLTVIQIKKDSELNQVTDFVMSDRVNTGKSKGDVVVHQPGGWKRGGELLPFRYEVFITEASSSNGRYLFVDVSRPWILGSPIFSVACSTTLPVGARDASVDVCKQ